MAKVFLIGTLPPQLLAGRRIEASHYRTWQFLQPLVEAGHDVVLCAGEAGGEHAASAGAAPLGLHALHSIGLRDRGWRSRLQRAHDAHRPDCVVAVNFLQALHATRLRTERPLWMDIYGDQITIQQSFCHRAGSDRGMPTTVRFMRQILSTADVVSACGEFQKHMLVGELAMSARLNCRTFGYEFVRVVLPGAPPAADAPPSDAVGRSAVRVQLGLTPEDFGVLWCGGYNTWTDVDTLYEGIARAMARNPRVHYISVGASTYEARDNMYERLLRRLEHSPHRARWHMLGWKPWSEVPQYYAGCDVGLNIDAMHYETIYGTRTRLVEMIGAGLPVVTTEGTEISALLRNAGAGLTFQPGDPAALARQVLALADDRTLADRMARSASETARTRFSFTTTTATLQDWVRAPARAPDREAGRGSARIATRHRLRGLARHVAWRVTARERQQP